MSGLAKLDKLYRECNYDFNEGDTMSYDEVIDKYTKKLIIDFGFSESCAKDFMDGCELEDDESIEVLIEDYVLTHIVGINIDSDILIKKFDKIGRLNRTFKELGVDLKESEKNSKKLIHDYEKGLENTGMITCPSCAEKIKKEAKKCRYCGGGTDEIYEKIKTFIRLNYKDVEVVSQEGNIIHTEWKKSNFSIILTIILLLIMVFPGVIYIIYCIIKPNVFIKGQIILSGEKVQSIKGGLPSPLSITRKINKYLSC